MLLKDYSGCWDEKRRQRGKFRSNDPSYMMVVWTRAVATSYKWSDPGYILKVVNRICWQVRYKILEKEGNWAWHQDVWPDQLEDRTTIHLDEEDCRRSRIGQEDHEFVSGHIKFETSIRQAHHIPVAEVTQTSLEGDIGQSESYQHRKGI